MSDFRALLSTLRRPRLLIRAAHCGMLDYHRERDLKRLLKGSLSPEHVVGHLMEEEERLEATRRAGALGYSVARHIEVLIALMVEVRLLPRNSAAI